jgi:hypothetical protein
MGSSVRCSICTESFFCARGEAALATCLVACLGFLVLAGFGEATSVETTPGTKLFCGGTVAGAGFSSGATGMLTGRNGWVLPAEMAYQT